VTIAGVGNVPDRSPVQGADDVGDETPTSQAGPQASATAQAAVAARRAIMRVTIVATRGLNAALQATLQEGQKKRSE
jgi:hypothetical protein